MSILTAKKPGQIMVTAYADKKKTQEIASVSLVIKDTKIIKKATIKYMDSTYNLRSTMTDLPAGKKITFSIPEKMKKYASVSENTGVITPVKNGKVKVTCCISHRV